MMRAAHSLWGLLRGLAWMSSLLAGIAAVPAGAATPQQALASALRARALAAPAQQLAAAASPVAPEEAALQLLDLAESAYPGFFPGRQPTQTLSPFVFRHYPQTGVYLGVVVIPDLGYEYLGVYAMGGTFGPQPTWVGPLVQFITPQRTRREWLAVEAGDDPRAAVAYYDFVREQSGRAIVVVDPADPSRWHVAEPAGRVAPHARVFAAEVGAAGTEVRRMRERWRTVFRNGRLMRLDLEPAAGQFPAWAQVSSFSTLSACADDQQVFQNWPDPERAWFIFPAPAEGATNCYSARGYRAVRLGMAATDAPLRLSARPVAAVRDLRGAIEGFVLEEGDGERLVLADANFQTVRVLADSAVTDSMEYHRLKAQGVHGRGDGRFLMFTRDYNYKPPQTLALPLAPGATPRVVGTGLQSLSAVAEDDSGLYVADNRRRLLHVRPDLTVRALTESLPLIDGRLFLTPTRIVMVAGNISPVAVISVPKTGGDADVLATLGSSGPPSPNLAVVDELVIAQDHTEGGLHIVNADGSGYQGVLPGYIAATLRPVSWYRHTGRTGFDDDSRLGTFGADNAAAVLIVEGQPFASLKDKPIVRYDQGGVRRIVGRFPTQTLRAFALASEPEATDVALVGGNGNGGLDRRLPIHQIGSHGLVYQPLVSTTTFTGSALVWLIDPSGSFTMIDVSSAVPVER
jgi:hypothetical protein